MKTKALISCAVTAQLICAFVFAYAKIWFSLDATRIILTIFNLGILKRKVHIFVLVYISVTMLDYVSMHYTHREAEKNKQVTQPMQYTENFFSIKN